MTIDAVTHRVDMALVTYFIALILFQAAFEIATEPALKKPNKPKQLFVLLSFIVLYWTVFATYYHLFFGALREIGTFLGVWAFGYLLTDAVAIIFKWPRWTQKKRIREYGLWNLDYSAWCAFGGFLAVMVYMQTLP